MGDHIRNFAKYFTNLLPSQQREFERVLYDLQNAKEISSLESSLSQLRRKVDQGLPIPQVVAKPTVRGATLEWEPLPDQRISLYEIDISDTNNFASFTTITTFGASADIDGLTATTFARVRGVRRDGTTSPYSETATINPRLFGITSHVQEDFYVSIVGDGVNTVLGGADSVLSYVPINENGNSMVWGFISMYADPAVAMWGIDEITIKCYAKIIATTGLTVSDTLVWEMTCGEHNQSQAIGPFTVAHPELNQTIEIRLDVQDATSLADGSARSFDSSEIWYCHMNVLELGL